MIAILKSGKGKLILRKILTLTWEDKSIGTRWGKLEIEHYKRTEFVFTVNNFWGFNNTLWYCGFWKKGCFCFNVRRKHIRNLIINSSNCSLLLRIGITWQRNSKSSFGRSLCLRCTWEIERNCLLETKRNSTPQSFVKTSIELGFIWEVYLVHSNNWIAK